MADSTHPDSNLIPERHTESHKRGIGLASTLKGQPIGFVPVRREQRGALHEVSTPYQNSAAQIPASLPPEHALQQAFHGPQSLNITLPQYGLGHDHQTTPPRRTVSQPTRAASITERSSSRSNIHPSQSTMAPPPVRQQRRRSTTQQSIKPPPPPPPPPLTPYHTSHLANALPIERVTSPVPKPLPSHGIIPQPLHTYQTQPRIAQQPANLLPLSPFDVFRSFDTGPTAETRHSVANAIPTMIVRPQPPTGDQGNLSVTEQPTASPVSILPQGQQLSNLDQPPRSPSPPHASTAPRKVGTKTISHPTTPPPSHDSVPGQWILYLILNGVQPYDIDRIYTNRQFVVRGTPSLAALEPFMIEWKAHRLPREWLKPLIDGTRPPPPVSSAVTRTYNDTDRAHAISIVNLILHSASLYLWPHDLSSALSRPRLTPQEQAAEKKLQHARTLARKADSKQRVYEPVASQEENAKAIGLLNHRLATVNKLESEAEKVREEAMEGMLGDEGRNEMVERLMWTWSAIDRKGGETDRKERRAVTW